MICPSVRTCVGPRAVCDPQNVPECNYDGGDCCSCTCVDTPSYTCGIAGFSCVDPSADCVEDDDITTGVVDNCEFVEAIGEDGAIPFSSLGVD